MPPGRRATMSALRGNRGADANVTGDGRGNSTSGSQGKSGKNVSGISQVSSNKNRCQKSLPGMQARRSRGRPTLLLQVRRETPSEIKPQESNKTAVRCQKNGKFAHWR